MSSNPTEPPDAVHGNWHPLAQAAAAVERALEEMAMVPAWTAPDPVVVDCLSRLSRASARLDAQRLRLVHEAEDRGVAVTRGAVSLPAWLRGVLNVRPGVAAREVELARALHTQCDATAAALSDGRINTDAATVITKAVMAMPPELHSRRDEAEQILLDRAVELDPAALTRIAAHLRAVTAPDRDDELAEDFAVRHRQLHLRTDPDDGCVHIRGWLDAEAGSMLRTALDAFSAPRPAENGGLDRRRPAVRAADALAELLRGVLDGGGLPTSGGQRPHLTVTFDWDTLHSRLTAAQAAGGGPSTRPAPTPPALTEWDSRLTPSTIRRLACDAKILPVVLAGQSQPLDVGRASYVVPAGLRAALTARDRGCTFGGCDRPPGWCQAHHIHHWADGGETKLDNLVLLCGYHHRFIHHRDWSVHIDPDGLPAFTPPKWIDPAQIPRRQTWRTDTTQLAADMRTVAGADAGHDPPS